MVNDDGCTYLPKLDSFERLFDQRSGDAIAVFPPGSAPHTELCRYRSIFAAALAELRDLYRAQYVDDDLPAAKQESSPPSRRTSRWPPSRTWRSCAA